MNRAHRRARPDRSSKVATNALDQPIRGLLKSLGLTGDPLRSTTGHDAPVVLTSDMLARTGTCGCQHCDADVRMQHTRDGWHLTVEHDNDCPILAKIRGNQ